MIESNNNKESRGDFYFRREQHFSCNSSNTFRGECTSSRGSTTLTSEPLLGSLTSKRRPTLWPTISEQTLRNFARARFWRQNKSLLALLFHATNHQQQQHTGEGGQLR